MAQEFTSKQEQKALKVLRSGVEQKYNYGIPSNQTIKEKSLLLPRAF